MVYEQMAHGTFTILSFETLQKKKRKKQRDLFSRNCMSKYVNKRSPEKAYINIILALLFFDSLIALHCADAVALAISIMSPTPKLGFFAFCHMWEGF